MFTLVLPCESFHCQLQEVVVTDGWFPWVVSEVALECSAGETKKKCIKKYLL